MTLLLRLLLSVVSGVVVAFIAYKLVVERFFSGFILIIILIAFFLFSTFISFWLILLSTTFQTADTTGYSYLDCVILQS